MQRSIGATQPGPALFRHMAHSDSLGLTDESGLNFKQVAELLQLSKADLATISGVKQNSVRFDYKIPAPMKTRLEEIANIANLVAEYFAGDRRKVQLWFELPNPMLGNVSPRAMIRAGRYENLLNFVLDARDAEQAAPRTDDRAGEQTERTSA